MCLLEDCPGPETNMSPTLPLEWEWGAREGLDPPLLLFTQSLPLLPRTRGEQRTPRGKEGEGKERGEGIAWGVMRKGSKACS